MNRRVIAFVALASLVAVGLSVVVGGRQSVSVSEPASLSENMAKRTSTAGENAHTGKSGKHAHCVN